MHRRTQQNYNIFGVTHIYIHSAVKINILHTTTTHAISAQYALALVYLVLIREYPEDDDLYYGRLLIVVGD